jgi:hypothetical protein
VIAGERETATNEEQSERNFRKNETRRETSQRFWDEGGCGMIRIEIAVKEEYMYGP